MLSTLYRVRESQEEARLAGWGSAWRGRARVFGPGRMKRPGIQVAPPLDFLGNEDIIRKPGLEPAHVGHDEVVYRPLPAPHSGANNFVVQILCERGTFLPELGVSWGRQVMHGVEYAGFGACPCKHILIM